jgi:hypothetical protein
VTRIIIPLAATIILLMLPAQASAARAPTAWEIKNTRIVITNANAWGHARLSCVTLARMRTHAPNNRWVRAYVGYKKDCRGTVVRGWTLVRWKKGSGWYLYQHSIAGRFDCRGGEHDGENPVPVVVADALSLRCD